jgi:dihydrofolate reductase
MTRRLVYLVAQSADGFIAHGDGRLDGFVFPQGEYMTDLCRTFPETIPGHQREALGVVAPNQRFDTVLMGRRTYQPALDAGIPSPYPHLRQIVFSRSLPARSDPNLMIVADDSLHIVQTLKSESGRDLWLCGGAELAATLFPEIDELILKIQPVVFGAGIQLFATAVEPTRFSLIQSRQFANGFMQLHYERLR